MTALMTLALSRIVWPGAIGVIIVVVIVGCVIKWAGFTASINRMLMVIAAAVLVVWLLLILLSLAGIVVI